MINVVIPMAGLGSRFSKAGYVDPKPLIEIHGVPMIKLVMENLRPNSFEHRFIFVIQNEHDRLYGLSEKLKGWAGAGCEIVGLDGLTEGAACTVLKARDLIDNDDELMIANCDQYVDVDIDNYLSTMNENNLDGLIMTMTADDPKWSFVHIDDKGYVDNVVEKRVISNEATVGVYNFRRGRDFVAAANEMLGKNLRVNGEFYVAPVYNELISAAGKIGIYNVGSEGSGMYGLGIPVDLEGFLIHPVSRKASEVAK